MSTNYKKPNQCLITDIWSTNAKDFIALAAAVTDECFDREIFTIDMMRMEQSHTSEYVKNCIETMVIKYNFNKSLLHGLSSDEGSNLTAAFPSPILDFDDQPAIVVNDVIDTEELIRQQESVNIDVEIENSACKENYLKIFLPN